MAWSKPLLVSLALLALCWGQESPCRIWSEYGDVLASDKYVFCQCNISVTTNRDIIFGIEEFPFELPIKVVDNFTLQMYVPFSIEVPIHMYCIVDQGLISERPGPKDLSMASTKKFHIIPKLQVRFFKCRAFPNEDIGNCTFSRISLHIFLEKNYFVSTNGLPKVQCVEFSPDEMECKSIHINQNITTHHFKIEMEVMGIIQVQEFSLNLHEIVIPNWEFIGVKNEFQSLESCICIEIFSQYKESKNIICKWVRDSWLTDYSSETYLDSNLIDLNHRSINCFFEGHLGYEKYQNRVFCRFGLDGSPWSEEYNFNCTTAAILPSKPPQILPNGFFCDTDREQLYVFWLHLEERDWNGPNFGYAAQSTDGKTATIVGNTTALFRNWEALLPTTIHIWSKNSEGRSVNSSRLNLSSLKNIKRQQPRNLHYNDEEQILTWDAPSDRNNLLGYTIYWCTASLNILQICDEEVELRMQALSLSQLQFPFLKSMNFSNMAVAARYSDKIGGGVRWEGYKWNINKNLRAEAPGAGISFYAAPIGVSILIVLIIFFHRKYRECRDINVILCEGLWRDSSTNLDTASTAPTALDPVVFPGSVSPEKVMDVNRLVPPAAEIENGSPEDGSGQNPDTKDTLAATDSYSHIRISDF